MKTKIAIAALGLSLFGNAHAGFDESLKALQAKDYATGLAEAKKAAEAGDPRGYYLMGIIYQSGYGVEANPQTAFESYQKAAQGKVNGAFSKLAWAYLRGDGTAKDKDKALVYARASASIDDAEGLFLVYLFLNNGVIGYLDANGRPDMDKYKRLASRPLTERALDIEAYDALYRSAAKGHPNATMVLASLMGGVLGDSNRQKLHELSAKLPADKYPAVWNYEKISRQMNSFGQSYATPQLFKDAYTMQLIAASMKDCGANTKKPDGTDQANPQLTSVSISIPLSDAVYLPSKVAGFEHAYLVAGNWEEEWKFTACGNSVAVKMKFLADGLGGASFQSVKPPKDSTEKAAL